MLQSQYNARTLVSSKIPQCSSYILLFILNTCIHWTAIQKTLSGPSEQFLLCGIVRSERRRWEKERLWPMRDLRQQSSNTLILHILLINWVYLWWAFANCIRSIPRQQYSISSDPDHIWYMLSVYCTIPYLGLNGAQGYAPALNENKKLMGSIQTHTHSHFFMYVVLDMRMTVWDGTSFHLKRHLSLVQSLLLKRHPCVIQTKNKRHNLQG